MAANKRIKIEINPNNMSKGQAEAAMLSSATVKHSSWDESEYIFYSRLKNIILDEEEKALGDFDDKFWQDKKLPQWGWQKIK
jgi:hypothetical protein